MAVINIINFEHIDAFFIKRIRKNSGDSADKLCKNLNISKPYLYNMENGEKNLSEAIFDKILNYYQINYDKDIRLYEEAYDLTIKLYESFVFKNNDLFEKYEKEFKEKETIFENSRGFIFNELMVAIINVLKNKKLSNEMLEEARKYLSLYDSNASFIFAIILGFVKNIHTNTENANNLICQIYNRTTNYDIYPSVKGMILFRMGKIKFEQKQYFEALKFYESAINSLQEIYCIERINQIKIEIANIYLFLGLYEQAENEYIKLLKESKKYEYKRRITTCLNNLSYLYFVQKRYDECEEYVYNAKEAGSTHPDLNYYLAYIAYLKQPKKQAKIVVNELLKNEEDLYTQRMLKMIQGFINDNQKQIDSFFNKTKKYLEKFDDVIEIKELYKLNIVYYKDKNLERYLQLVEEYHNILGN